MHSLSRWPRLALDRLCGGRPNYREHRRRTSTRHYRRRKDLCFWVWLTAALVMAVQPTGQVAIVAVLTATFLSFAILDEE